MSASRGELTRDNVSYHRVIRLYRKHPQVGSSSNPKGVEVCFSVVVIFILGVL